MPFMSFCKEPHAFSTIGLLVSLPCRADFTFRDLNFFVALPKNPKAQDFSFFIAIGLMSHITKLLLKVTQRGIADTILQKMSRL